MTVLTASVLSGTLGAVLVALVVLVATGAIAWALISLVVRDKVQTVDESLSPYSLGHSPVEPTVAVKSGGSTDLVETPILQRAVIAVGEIASQRGILQYLDRKLKQADLPVRPAEAFFVYLVATVLAGLLGLLLGGPIAGLICLGVVGIVPWVALSIAADRRRTAFTAQLPDLLQLLATTLRSGFSVLQGLETVSRQLPDPVGEEMRHVVAEARLGRPLYESLNEVAKRIGSEDFEWVVTAIGIQREVGGNLAELLDIVSDTMNARARLRREVKTLTAEGRIGAIIIAILPVAIGLFVYAVNPGYLQPLFHSTVGKIMFYGSIVLAAIGIFWLRQIVQIEI